MNPHGHIAQRFPLVARFRPACLPLPKRVHTLVAVADRAVRTADQGLASVVYNQVALIASDLGLPELAREMCHQQAVAYLHACPLPGTAAISALTPVVNLARLRIRAGHSDEGRHRLLALYEAVGAGSAARFEGVTVPDGLVSTPEERQEVRTWLWRVLIDDGTRTLTTAGRWTEALAHIESHRGIGKHMLDGRQVAVLAALTSGKAPAADALLAATTSGEPWEQDVTASLAVLCRRALGRPVDEHLTALVDAYTQRETDQRLTVFHTRLGLVILDLVEWSEHPAARLVVDALYRRTVSTADGYAARECLAHPQFQTLATEQQTRDCADLLRTCALGAGALPGSLRAALTDALQVSDRVIRDSVAPRSKSKA